MRRTLSGIYRCPKTREPLSLVSSRIENEAVVTATLVSVSGARYDIVDGIPDLTYPNPLPQSDQLSREEYDRSADSYDANMEFTFQTFGVDEGRVREKMVSELRIEPGSKILETGAGSGRDTEIIAGRLDANGLLCVQDLSLPFLKKAVEKLARFSVPIEYAVANACYLPFADGFFDATYHFGGINTFGDIHRAFQEAVRVTRVGGRVVIGDEGLSPWLRSTEYGRILVNGNPLYGCDIPFSAVPVEARDVKVQWLIGSAFYLISFTVGDGAPKANFDVPIPGVRGGTFNTRFFGKLEGISPEVRELAWAASRKSDESMAEWLNRIVQEAAEKDLRD